MLIAIFSFYILVFDHSHQEYKLLDVVSVSLYTLPKAVLQGAEHLHCSGHSVTFFRSEKNKFTVYQYNFGNKKTLPIFNIKYPGNLYVTYPNNLSVISHLENIYLGSPIFEKTDRRLILWAGEKKDHKCKEYILSKRLKDSIFIVIDTTSFLIEPLLYSKRFQTLIYTISGKINEEWSKIMAYDFLKKRKKEIVEGYYYPVNLLSDSLVLIVDFTQYNNRCSKGDFTDFRRDFLTYNIKNREIKILKKNIVATTGVIEDKKIYFVNTICKKKNTIQIKDNRLFKEITLPFDFTIIGYLSNNIK